MDKKKPLSVDVKQKPSSTAPLSKSTQNGPYIRLRKLTIQDVPPRLYHFRWIAPLGGVGDIPTLNVHPSCERYVNDFNAEMKDRLRDSSKLPNVIDLQLQLSSFFLSVYKTKEYAVSPEEQTRFLGGDYDVPKDNEIQQREEGRMPRLVVSPGPRMIELGVEIYVLEYSGSDAIPDYSKGCLEKVCLVWRCIPGSFCVESEILEAFDQHGLGSGLAATSHQTINNAPQNHEESSRQTSVSGNPSGRVQSHLQASGSGSSTTALHNANHGADLREDTDTGDTRMGLGSFNTRSRFASHYAGRDLNQFYTLSDLVVAINRNPPASKSERMRRMGTAAKTIEKVIEGTVMQQYDDDNDPDNDTIDDESDSGEDENDRAYDSNDDSDQRRAEDGTDRESNGNDIAMASVMQAPAQIPVQAPAISSLPNQAPPIQAPIHAPAVPVPAQVAVQAPAQVQTPQPAHAIIRYIGGGPKTRHGMHPIWEDVGLGGWITQMERGNWTKAVCVQRLTANLMGMTCTQLLSTNYANWFTVVNPGPAGAMIGEVQNLDAML